MSIAPEQIVLIIMKKLAKLEFQNQQLERRIMQLENPGVDYE